MLWNQDAYPVVSSSRGNSKWLDEHTLAAVLDFDDDVLGAPVYPGLLYLASTHQGRLSKVIYGYMA